MPSAARHPDRNASWLESLSPWPEEFGLTHMEQLLSALGDPQRSFPAIHVLGTNGKTTTVRLIEELLSGEGLAVGAYTSPHVLGWAERIRVRGAEVDLERSLERVRGAAEQAGATQFEVLTAAALAEFAAQEVDVAVVEAGLGGRLDATNVLGARVVVLTNVGLEHTEVLGDTRELIAAEKLAVTPPGATVILGEPEWEEAARAAGAESAVFAGSTNLALALAAAETFLGRQVDPAPAEDLGIPGRLEHVSEEPLEIWDGAHNLAGVGWLLGRLPSRRYVVVASILEDKDADGMLAALSPLGDMFVATASGNLRAIPPNELAERAREFFSEVTAVAAPDRAVSFAREVAGDDGAVLVTGSLYLLADLASFRPATALPWRQ
jgi:dihydrofolate synthase/folylpolyglutamate synthase